MTHQPAHPYKPPLPLTPTTHARTCVHIQVENSSKQSVYKFLKVLEGLRRWELCSPDVSAAVEFCRARVVEMAVEEYEEWIAQAFPAVVRPKTAPAGLARGQGQHQQQQQGVASEDADAEASGAEGRGGAGGGGVEGRMGGVRSSAAVRGSVKSAVSVANGADGKRRMVQSAVAKGRR
ncbi:uncharacterized protein LOC118477742 [Aplysia californica]|uniref:Uncharacterized protein LOC118477742 n=1 Tax=Aplysia californica TaxID=6500 RepID=A0ABM1VTX7_APLCA|nr:uncharacterized protein LOC118477742 [Aplysia californica]